MMNFTNIFSGVSFTRILFYVCVGLLVVCFLLSWNLKRAYESYGEAEADLKHAEDTIRLQHQEQLKSYESAEASREIAQDAITNKQLIDGKFDSIEAKFDKLHKLALMNRINQNQSVTLEQSTEKGVKHENKEQDVDVLAIPLDGDTIRLLNDAYREACPNCSTSGTDAGLSGRTVAWKNRG